MTLLKRLFSRTPNHFKNSEQVIEYAFTCGGVKYYQHVDEMNMPFRRALKALTYYNEMSMKITPEYLEQFIKGFDGVLAQPKFNVDSLVSLKTLVNQLRERQKITFLPDHVYKLASVRFFDETENPNDYDYKYNARKIEAWKQSEAATDFFLREPIVRLMPFLKLPPQDLSNYIQAVEEMEREHLAFISAITSRSPKTSSSPSIKG